MKIRYKKIISAFIVSALIGCSFGSATEAAEVKNTKIAVFSDPHYYAPELGTTGSAFEAYLAQDRKLLAESRAISAAAIDELKKSDAKIVLISGDLTKDGEKLSHQQFSKLLTSLENSGKKVYVIPGNHDINNPASSSYKGDKATFTDNISPDQFKNIYNNFGFSEAISRDKSSLSYVVEPVPGLIVIAMDSAQYVNNSKKNTPNTGGAFSDSTYKWIKKQIKEAKSKGKTVIGVMHHGLLEHFKGQKQYYSDFVIDNWEKISEDFADSGMAAVFTGHYHAQDITSKTTASGNKIYDIETGSLVSYPSPYRILDITKDKITVESKYIKNINYNTKGIPYQDYAYNYLKKGMKEQLPLTFSIYLTKSIPALTKEQAYIISKMIANIKPAPGSTSMTISDLLGDAMIAHYKGDEKPNPTVTKVAQNMMSGGNQLTGTLGFLLNSAYSDLSEKDNDAVLSIK